MYEPELEGFLKAVEDNRCMHPAKTPVRCLLLLIPMALMMALSAAVASAQVSVPVSSDFESGLEGWTIVTGQNATLSHFGTGGSRGGYAHFVDDGIGRSDLQAPAAYLGDWSSLDGVGSLSWDHRIFALGNLPQGPPYKVFEAVIEGNGNLARFVSVATAQMSWTTATAPIDESAWSMESGNWGDLLADVQDLQIRIELVGNDGGLPGDEDGIDNVRLAGAQSLSVPTIAPMGLLLVAGILVLLGRRGASAQFPPAVTAGATHGKSAIG